MDAARVFRAWPALFEIKDVAQKAKVQAEACTLWQRATRDQWKWKSAVSVGPGWFGLPVGNATTSCWQVSLKLFGDLALNCHVLGGVAGGALNCSPDWPAAEATVSVEADAREPQATGKN